MASPVLLKTSRMFLYFIAFPCSLHRSRSKHKMQANCFNPIAVIRISIKIVAKARPYLSQTWQQFEHTLMSPSLTNAVMSAGFLRLCKRHRGAGFR